MLRPTGLKSTPKPSSDTKVPGPHSLSIRRASDCPWDVLRCPSTPVSPATLPACLVAFAGPLTRCPNRTGGRAGRACAAASPPRVRPSRRPSRTGRPWPHGRGSPPARFPPRTQTGRRQRFRPSPPGQQASRARSSRAGPGPCTPCAGRVPWPPDPWTLLRRGQTATAPADPTRRESRHSAPRPCCMPRRRRRRP